MDNEMKKKLFHYHTDEMREALISLQFFIKFLNQLIRRQDSVYWKWMVIALHNAVQGYMVAALKGSNGFSTLKQVGMRGKENKIEWMKEKPEKIYENYLRNPEENLPLFTDEKLLDFFSLYKCIKSERSMSIYNCEQFFPSKR